MDLSFYQNTISGILLHIKFCVDEFVLFYTHSTFSGKVSQKLVFIVLCNTPLGIVLTFLLMLYYKSERILEKVHIQYPVA